MKAVIVEDSRLARVELKQLLKEHPGVEIIAEAKDMRSAQLALAKHQADLIFLDINLPDGDGFELLQSLAHCPQVIFTTAYDEYAIKAFEYNALDYLMKPINPKRLQQALEKLDTTDDTHDNAIDHKIFVKDGDRCWLIDIHQVRYFESCGNYVRLYFDAHQPLVYKSLSSIEKRLQEKVFFRTNRQYIVNVNFIQSIEASGSTGLFLTMDDGKEIEVSRRHTSHFKNMLSI